MSCIHRSRIYDTKTIVFAAIFALVANGLPSAPRGQEATDKPSIKETDEAIKLEAVSVTGSNIKRLAVEKVPPVTIISAGAMEVRTPLTPAALLPPPPQVTTLPLN